MADDNELGSVEFFGYLVPKADIPAGALNHSTRPPRDDQALSLTAGR